MEHNNVSPSIYSIMFKEYPDIVTVAQLQKMLHISRQLSYELINSGQIRAFKVGNSYRIPKIDVIDFVMKSQRRYLRETHLTAESHS